MSSELVYSGTDWSVADLGRWWLEFGANTDKVW